MARQTQKGHSGRNKGVAAVGLPLAASVRLSGSVVWGNITMRCGLETAGKEGWGMVFLGRNFLGKRWVDNIFNAGRSDISSSHVVVFTGRRI